MIASQSASAPGKVVLSGEYAVLDGAPAIAMAVNRRAYARVSNATTGTVTAPGFSDQAGQFKLNQSALEWLEGSPEFDVLSFVWRALRTAPTSPFALQLDSSEFIDPNSRRKFGIGSSAATTVALSAALAATTGIAAVAHQAHHNMQGGLGSGVDVACALHGGLIEYHMGSDAKPLNWPDGLAYRLLWTGVSASTRDKISRLNVSREQPSRAALKQAAIANAAAWRTGSANAVAESSREYTHILYDFSEEHDLGIFAAGHEALWRGAERANVCYKPCGAGGGDIGIVCSPNESMLHDFLNSLDDSCQVLDFALEPSGVRVEEQELT